MKREAATNRCSLHYVALGRTRSWVRSFFFAFDWRMKLVVLMVVTGGGLLASGGYIHAKAALGQYLIRDAWQQSLNSGEAVKPWRWADTWPVARLRVPGLGVDQIVLAGDSGQSLAFGPGHNSASAAPGYDGTTVISGHRDTHFGFLEALQPGQVISLQNAQQKTVRYRVSNTDIIDTRSDSICMGQNGRILLLVTCWPFDGVQPNTAWRYLVIAEELESA